MSLCSIDNSNLPATALTEKVGTTREELVCVTSRSGLFKLRSGVLHVNCFMMFSKQSQFPIRGIGVDNNVDM